MAEKEGRKKLGNQKGGDGRFGEGRTMEVGCERWRKKDRRRMDKWRGCGWKQAWGSGILEKEEMEVILMKSET